MFSHSIIILYCGINLYKISRSENEMKGRDIEKMEQCLFQFKHISIDK
jgi:hypothetical protein